MGLYGVKVRRKVAHISRLSLSLPENMSAIVDGTDDNHEEWKQVSTYTILYYLFDSFCYIRFNKKKEMFCMRMPVASCTGGNASCTGGNVSC